MQKKIGILGCGWLGFPLAKHFIKKGYQVRGSTTSLDKIVSLALHDINPFLIAIHNHHSEGNLDYFLKDLDVLIISVPAKLKANPESNFVSKIKRLIERIKKSKTTNIILVRSTCVYGKSLAVVDEGSPSLPETSSGRQVLDVVKLLMDCTSLSI